MSVDLRLPNITASSDSEKIAQLTKYIYQLTEQLNFSLNTIETNVGNSYVVNNSSSGSASSQDEYEKLLESYSAVKSMIIKSADFIQSIETELSTSLSGSYVASSTFGTYQQTTDATLTANSTGITQLYGYTSNIRSDYGDFDVENETYIKTGLLYEDNSQPVYGVGIGLLSATSDANGHRVIDRGNIATTFSADEIAFWGNDIKLASITPYSVYFPSGVLTAYGATISGDITASSGKIGGWNITSSYIDSTITDTSKRLFLASASDSSSYWIGATDTSGNCVFYVTKQGKLYAEGAEISGSITSDSGTIGGWSITSGRISKSITVGSTEYEAMMNAPSSFGSNSPGDYVAFGVKKGGSFVSYIDYSGGLHSTKGDIAGWTINSTMLYNGYTIGGKDYEAIINAPSSIATASGYVAFGVRVDDEFQAYIDYAGKLCAKNADIKGKITATSGSFTGSVTTGSLSATGGTIGGWVISDSYIRSSSGAYGTYKWTNASNALYDDAVTGYLFTYLFDDGIEYRVYTSNSVTSTLKYYSRKPFKSGGSQTTTGNA